MKNQKKINKFYSNQIFSCPIESEELSWNQHPRIYIDLRNKNEATCPYCGNFFIIER